MQGARELSTSEAVTSGSVRGGFEAIRTKRSRKALLLGEEPRKIKSGGKPACAFVEHEGRQKGRAPSAGAPAAASPQRASSSRCARMSASYASSSSPTSKAHAARNVEKPYADAAAVVGAREGGRDGTHEDVHVLAEGLEPLRLRARSGDAKKRLAELRKLGRECAAGIVGGDVRHFLLPIQAGRVRQGGRSFRRPRGRIRRPGCLRGASPGIALTPRRNT